MENRDLKKIANDVRKGIVTAVHAGASGHPGGSLSAADIVTYLFFEEMNIDPKDPKKEDRDRFVMSKGHASPCLYSVMAHRGYFPVEELTTFRKLGSRLQGHPCMQELPGIDMSTGSLGQGVSAACGMALAGKLKCRDENHQFTETQSSATARSRKDKCGRLPCSQARSIWTT